MLGIAGSKYVGSFIKKASPEVLTILGALDGMNDPQRQAKIAGVDDLAPFIGVVEGLNGQVQAFKNTTIKGVKDTEYGDAPIYNETFDQWYFTREGIRVRDSEFSLSAIMDADERSTPIGDVVKERIKAVSEWYMNQYLRNVWYATLLTLPTVQQASSFRAAPVGLLKNTPVDRTFLKPGTTKTTRNNYKAVADATTGITIDDLEKFVTEFTEFSNITDGNIVIYATRGTLSKLRATIAADVNKDLFNRTGKPTEVILGIQFIQNDMIPAGKMLMLDGNMRNGLTHFVSPKPYMRGIQVIKDVGNGFDKIESVKDFIGSHFKVMPEGHFITSREKFMWIDTLNDAADDDLNMSDTGLGQLTYYKNLYEKMYLV